MHGLGKVPRAARLVRVRVARDRRFIMHSSTFISMISVQKSVVNIPLSGRTTYSRLTADQTCLSDLKPRGDSAPHTSVRVSSSVHGMASATCERTGILNTFVIVNRLVNNESLICLFVFDNMHQSIGSSQHVVSSSTTFGNLLSNKIM